jgi:hypothetical protein
VNRSVEIERATVEVEHEAHVYTLRQDIAGLLKMIGRARVEDVSTLLEKATLYDTDVDNLIALMGGSNPILQILKEEIREARSILERIRTRPAYEASVDMSIIGQHARYLSQGGGTRATSGGIVLSQAVAQDPFMSPLSRQVSGGAAVSVSTMHHDTEDPEFSTASLGPVPLMRTPSRQTAGGLVMPLLPPRPTRLMRSIAMSANLPSPTSWTRMQASSSPITEEEDDPAIPASLPATPPSLSEAIMGHEEFMQMIAGVSDASQETFVGAGLTHPPVRYTSFDELVNNTGPDTRILSGGVAYPLPARIRPPLP